MKKPTAKKPASTLQKFPKINRFFTEWYVFPTAFAIILVLMIVILGVQYFELSSRYQEEKDRRSRVQEEVVFWGKVVEKYPDYRDAYFKIALLEYTLGNTNRSKEFVQKALELDPNFEKGRELERVLE